MAEWYDRLTTGLQRKGEICRDVLGRERWDLALILFPEVHWVMHLLWQTRDRDDPDYDPEVSLPFDGVFLDLYRKMDAWIGRFRERMPGSGGLVFSGSGLGPNCSGWHLLPEVLERIGLGPAAGALPRLSWPSTWNQRTVRTALWHTDFPGSRPYDGHLPQVRGALCDVHGLLLH